MAISGSINFISASLTGSENIHVDFVGLNTLIVDVVSGASNNLGIPASLDASEYYNSAIEAQGDPTNPNQSQYEVYTTTTDANGLYLFENLPSGDYQVAVDTSTIPTDMYQTSDYDDPATTSPTTPHTSSYTLTDVLNDDDEIE